MQVTRASAGALLKNAPKKRSSETVGRATPTQARAKESVEKILATAAHLLDEVGLEGFNTNLLAERAGVRIRTVYRYFPDKYGIILALTKQFAVQWQEWEVSMFKRLADPRSDWKTALRDSRIEWLRNARRIPGALSVLAAINATPELSDFHFQISENSSRNAAIALRARGLKLPPIRLLSIARTIIVAITTAIDLHLRLCGPEARALIDELDINLERYLDPYLRDTQSVSPRGVAS